MHKARKFGRHAIGRFPLEIIPVSRMARQQRILVKAELVRRDPIWGNLHNVSSPRTPYICNYMCVSYILPV